MISKEDAIIGAYIAIDCALDAMKRTDILKGYDLAQHHMEMAREALAESGVDVPIRALRKWRGAA